MTKRKKKIQDFAALKYKWMEKAKTPREYTEFKAAFDGITEDMIVNDKVDVYLGHFLDHYVYHHPTSKAKRDAEYQKKQREKEDEKKSQDNNIELVVEDVEN